MTFTVYVNWHTRKIISAEEYEKKIREEVSSLMNEEDEFNEWLNESYLPQEIWHMTGARRAEAWSLWEEYCRDTVEANDNYEKASFKI